MRGGAIALLAGLLTVSIVAAGCSSFGWREFTWKGGGGADFSFAIEYPDYFLPQAEPVPVPGRIVLLGVATETGFRSMPSMVVVDWKKVDPKGGIDRLLKDLGKGTAAWKPVQVAGHAGFRCEESNWELLVVQPKGCKTACVVQVLYGIPKQKKIVQDCDRMLRSVKVGKI